MKTFKKYDSAFKANKLQLPILKVGNLYCVLEEEDSAYPDGIKFAVIDSPKGQYLGYITVKHLKRLGNGNWADANVPY